MIDISKLSTAETIELRNACNRKLHKDWGAPNAECITKANTQLNSLFNEDYYLDKIKQGDYSCQQLLTIRGNARRQGWEHIISFLNSEEEAIQEGEEKAVNSNGFWAMMEKRANELGG